MKKVLMLLFCSIVSSEGVAVLYTDDHRPPPGFESIGEPEEAYVDVYFQGELVDASFVEYTDQWVHFLEPKLLLDKIKNKIKEEDFNLLLKQLEKRQPAHEDQVCYDGETVDCGLLSPEIVGVIFDISEFKLDFFVNNALIKESYLKDVSILSDSSADMGLLTHLNLLLYGGGSQGDYGIKGSYVDIDSVWSYGNARLNMEGFFSQTGYGGQTVLSEKKGLDQLNIEYNMKKHLYHAGLINSWPSQMVAPLPLWGVSVEAEKRVLTEGLNYGSPIMVHLDFPSTVSLYKGDRMYATQHYEAGNQQLDTSKLPAGAYAITIKILDDRGNQTEKKQLFSKSLQLPPFNHDPYKIMLGYLAENTADSPEYMPMGITEKRIAIGHYASRLSGHYGYELELIGGSRLLYLEGAGFYIDKETIGALAALYEVDGAYKLSGNIRRKYSDFSLSLSGSYSQGSTEGAFLSLIDGDGQQMSLGLSSSILGVNANMVARYGVLAQDEVDKNVMLTLSKSFYPLQSLGIEMSTGLSWEEDDTSYFIKGTLNYTPRSDIKLKLNSGYSKEQGAQAQLSVNQKQDYASGKGNVGYRINDQKEQVASYSYGGHYKHTYITSGVQLDHKTGETALTYDTTLGSSFVLSTHGVHISANTGSENGSGVMVDLSRDEPGLFVRVNGTKQKTIENSKQFIALEPFNTYTIQLDYDGMPEYTFNEDKQKVTVYPGNVVNMHFEIHRQYLLMTQVVSEQGKPITYHVVEGGDAANYTDEEGYLDAEVIEGQSWLKLKSIRDGSTCSIKISGLTVIDGIADLGEAVCHREPIID